MVNIQHVRRVYGYAEARYCAKCGKWPADEWAARSSDVEAVAFAPDDVVPLCEDCLTSVSGDAASEVSPETESPKSVELIGDGIADDTVALQAALDAATPEATKKSKNLRQCNDCDFQAIPPGMGAHLKKSEHSGWKPVE